MLLWELRKLKLQTYSYLPLNQSPAFFPKLCPTLLLEINLNEPDGNPKQFNILLKRSIYYSNHDLTRLIRDFSKNLPAFTAVEMKNI